MLVRIRVLLFGVLKDLAGQSLIDADFPNGSSVAAVLENSAVAWPRIRTLLPSIAVAVNR